VVGSKAVGEDLDPPIRSDVWRSVVRVSSGDVCSETALAVDRTSTHLHLLVNLHLWIDTRFTHHLSAALVFVGYWLPLSAPK
jgi:hypothetical protein